MSESAKTIAFLALGAVALLAAWFIERPTQAVSTDRLVGTMLNTDFEVDAPKRMRIVKFDRTTADTRQFEVASLDGVWSIPSKENYPADATTQMAAAANALIDRKILRIAGETAQSHDELGVVDPLASSLNSDSQGVGTRVTMYDGDDKVLVDMIIGKQVKGTEGQRYVREANKDVVYVVELDSESLSTSFDDWIEDDLLKISPFDIRQVFINDYSADLGFGMTPDGRITPQISWDRRGQITLGYNNEDAKWVLLDLKKYNQQQKEMVPDELGPNEELNQEALADFRNGLDDLLIVDVAKKPEGLSADLKAGEDFMTNEEAFQDLVSKGFSPVPITPGAPPEILSSEGEIITTMRDGVEYVLRFGQLKIQTDSGESVTADPANPETGEPASAGGDGEVASATGSGGAELPKDPDGKNLHRYLFVMARFNEDIIEKPELKELPPDEPASADEDDGEPASAGGDGEPASAGGEPEQESATETNSPDASETDKLAEERQRIEEENKRAQDQYNETVEAGKQRVQELNQRFGDWYYVISNDVYKQIHLSRDDVIKQKDPAGDPAAGETASAGGEESPLSGLPNLPAAEAESEPGRPGPGVTSTDSAQPTEQPASNDAPPADQSKVEPASNKDAAEASPQP